jgi:hypothetical protein
MPPPAPLNLRAGPLTLVFEPDTVFLRSVRLGDVEVVRAVYGAVRDRFWRTVPPRLAELNGESRTDSFRLGFGVVCQVREIDFYWRGELTGNADGVVVFSFDGQARSGFLRNRIGLCVLHPLLGCVGRPCVVERVDGRVEHGLFPRYIAPHQPFTQVRALTHEPEPGVRVEVRFAGDVFEMEDQRNWTDASFKTYGTPLSLPYPVRIEPGTRVRQSVTISLLGQTSLAARPAVSDTPTLVIPAQPNLRRPPLGLGVASHDHPLTQREVACLKRLALSHLRVDLSLAAPDWRPALRRAADQARQLGAALHPALFLSGNPEGDFHTIAAEIQTLRPPVGLWLIFQAGAKATPDRCVRLAQETLAPLTPQAPIAAGTNLYFTELNRNRPPADSPALPCYSLNPQVHVFDDQSLIENLEAQPHTVECARQFSPRPVVISPVTLRPRFNPNIIASPQEVSRLDLPPEVDARQASLLAAGWTLGSIARLGLTGHVHSLTYYETTGWRGVMESETIPPRPGQFPSRPGGVFPLYHVLAALAGFDRQAPMLCNQPLTVEATTLFDDQGRCRVLLANLQRRPQIVLLRTALPTARLRTLDETNAELAALSPQTFLSLPPKVIHAHSGVFEFVLSPHAFAWLDIEPPAPSA